MSKKFTQMTFTRVPFSGLDSNSPNKYPTGTQGNSSVITSIKFKPTEHISDFPVNDFNAARVAYNDSGHVQRLGYLTGKGKYQTKMQVQEPDQMHVWYQTSGIKIAQFCDRPDSDQWIMNSAQKHLGLPVQKQTIEMCMPTDSGHNQVGESQPEY
jgi:hypothetical protein